MTEMTEPALRRVQDAIRADSESFDMVDWVQAKWRWSDPDGRGSREICETTMCIGGTAVVQAGYCVPVFNPRTNDYEFELTDKGRAAATEYVRERTPGLPEEQVQSGVELYGAGLMYDLALGLDEMESGRLLFWSNWPRALREEYIAGREDPRVRADVAIRRIDHFLATQGKE